jgi:hypothetical protein
MVFCYKLIFDKVIFYKVSDSHLVLGLQRAENEKNYKIIRNKKLAYNVLVLDYKVGNVYACSHTKNVFVGQVSKLFPIIFRA